MARAHIGFGGNEGEVEDNLRSALKAIQGLPQTRIVRVSSLYRTTPEGVLDQADFVNGVLEVDTGLEPLGLLQALLRIEASLGRTRVVRWGPRTVDLDLLLWEGCALDTPELTLPHPRMHERAFVLVPFTEIRPDAVHPGSGRAVRELLAALGPTRGVVPIGRPAWVNALEEGFL